MLILAFLSVPFLSHYYSQSTSHSTSYLRYCGYYFYADDMQTYMAFAFNNINETWKIWMLILPNSFTYAAILINVKWSYLIRRDVAVTSIKIHNGSSFNEWICIGCCVAILPSKLKFYINITNLILTEIPNSYYAILLYWVNLITAILYTVLIERIKNRI